MKVVSYCPGLNLVKIYFSCLAALTNSDVYLSLAKFSSSLVDIEICHNQCKLDKPIRGGILNKSYNKQIC